MCGIAGFIDFSRAFTNGEAKAVLDRMGRSMIHRGPDDGGVWHDVDSGVGLTQRRLAIIDLSVEGHQPMESACGRFVVVFNGEIYNFGAIRADLDARGLSPPWRGHSDTEVLLAAIVAFGLDQALALFNGMFAIALWDKCDRKLHLARDRLGEKPLYLTRDAKRLVFSSETRGIQCFPGFSDEVDRGSLTQLLRFGYIPAPRSIFANVRKLAPGSVLTIDATTGDERSWRYWSFEAIVRDGLDRRDVGDGGDAIDGMDALISDAVRLRMVSDVPVGVFLSGGIDSSLVAALMVENATASVRTYSIGFTDREFDEAPHARRIADHLGTSHTEFYVTAREALEVVPMLPDIYDEPFADASQIPTYLLSRLSRREVTVALGGDGGDEIFCGYSRYVMGAQRWAALRRVPLSVRKAVAAALVACPDRLLDLLGRLLRYQRPSQGASSPFPTRVLGLADLLSVSSYQGMSRFMASTWRRPEEIVLAGAEPRSVYTDPDFGEWLESLPELMMAADTMQYLPDDILVKTDRASMAVSLELRSPLLDHRIIEAAWRLPLSLKLNERSGKLPLVAALERRVPRELFDRPKMGFGVPLESWLRGPLREWCESLLSEDRLRSDGFFDSSLVRARWQQHVSGSHNWSQHVWNVLAFQAWLDRQRRPSSPGLS